MPTMASTLVETVVHKSDYETKVEEPPLAYTIPATLYTDTSVPVTPAEEYELPTLPTTRVASLSLSTEPIGTPSPAELRRARKKEYLAFGVFLWAIWLEGWNDGSNGPLIPAMQKHYHIGFAVVSLIFIMNCIGFVSGAVANVQMSDKLGLGTTITIGACLQAVAYAIQAPAPPFPLFVLTFILSGFGIALQNALSMVFVMHLNSNSPAKMGVLNAAYGIGALCAPLSATKFASRPHWSFHYFTSLGAAVLNVTLLSYVLRFRPLDVILKDAGQVVREHDNSQANHYKEILSLKVVHLMSIFSLMYVGAEVTIGGWIVTFVIDERGGGASSGYITTGFFAGLTLGRVAFIRLNQKVGERRIMWFYILIAIGLEITIWLVPSLIGNAVAVSLVGLVLGPIYPIVMNRTARLVPHWLLSGAVGWIASLGQTGSALLPFITGAMSSKFGVKSLQPLVVSVMGVMVCLWAALPPDIHRTD